MSAYLIEASKHCQLCNNATVWVFGIGWVHAGALFCKEIGGFKYHAAVCK